VRSSFDLERPAGADLPQPAWPDGVTTRPFDPDRDAEEVHALVYSVWSDVPGHHDRPLEEWRHLFLGFEGFDPALQVLAVRHGRAVAVALCRTYAGTDGWVAQLAVGRDARGLGLGRAVLCEALRRLTATEGVETVGLSVQAENAAALRLYRSVGLEVARELVVHTRRAGGAG
jgi:mycothiol synthase